MTAYEMRISDWSSDVCSSDLEAGDRHHDAIGVLADLLDVVGRIAQGAFLAHRVQGLKQAVEADGGAIGRGKVDGTHVHIRSEERSVGKECVSQCTSRWSRSH